MNFYLLLLLSVFSFSKDADLSLRPKVVIPKQEEKSLNLEQYKNIEIKSQNENAKTDCNTDAGNKYSPGTPGYEICKASQNKSKSVIENEKLQQDQFQRQNDIPSVMGNH